MTDVSDLSHSVVARNRSRGPDRRFKKPMTSNDNLHVAVSRRPLTALGHSPKVLKASREGLYRNASVIQRDPNFRRWTTAPAGPYCGHSWPGASTHRTLRMIQP